MQATRYQLKRANARGYNAFKLYKKSILENPYKEQSPLHREWLKGYVKATNIQLSQVIAPEGRAPIIRSFTNIEIKKSNRKKFKIKDPKQKPRDLEIARTLQPIIKTSHNYYLGYIKPPSRKFRIFTSNPPENENVKLK